MKNRWVFSSSTLAQQDAVECYPAPIRNRRIDGGTLPAPHTEAGILLAISKLFTVHHVSPTQKKPFLLRPLFLTQQHAPGGLVSRYMLSGAVMTYPFTRYSLLRPLSGAMIAVLLAGCGTLAPDYHRPASPIANQWPTQSATVNSSGIVVDLPWQELFADAKLRHLIRLALDNNRDLRVAALNVEKTRAQYHIQRAELIPEVSITGEGSSGRTPSSISPMGVGGVSHAYYLDVGLSAYELDLFGRIRSLKNEALQTYLATEETRRATHISLISEVAGSYLTLAADLDLQRLTHDTRRSRQDAYELQKTLAEVGNASRLELRQAESELESARADALTADNQVATDRNALELLVGTPLSADLLPGTGSLPKMLSVHQIPAGLPSDLLHNRPDILSAEHTLMGANADIGAARAAFFPTISLTTGLGRASNELSSLFDAGGRYWTFAPQITMPIFSAGRLQAALDVSKVNRDIYVAQYEQTIQTAFREVADALAQRSVVDDQVEALRKRTLASQESYDLVQARYKEGIADYLDILDAQRTLYAAQQARIQAELAQQTSVVTLYKTLGGGWMNTGQHASADSKTSSSAPRSNAHEVTP